MKNRIDPLITISIEEYNELIEFRDSFKKAFDEKKTILFNDSWFPGHTGYAVNKFTIVNQDKLIDDLKNSIDRVKAEKERFRIENFELKEQISKLKKRWYHFKY